LKILVCNQKVIILKNILLNFFADVFEVLAKRVEAFLEVKEDNEQAFADNQTLVLLLGVSLFITFVQFISFL
jgi:hypothetical protein